MKEKERKTTYVWKRLLAIVLTAAMLPIGALQGAWADTTDSAASVNAQEINVGPIDTQIYTGTEIEPAVTVTMGGQTLQKDTDYTVSYSNNINVGAATVKITGKGSYAGSNAQAAFSISPRDIAEATVAPINNWDYTGYDIFPAPEVKYNGTLLETPKDYTVSYRENKDIGEGEILIIGAGNFRGAKTVTFRIVGKSLRSATIEPIKDQTYTGKEITPALSVKYNNSTLTQGVDYSVEYTNNVNVGMADVRITGKGAYADSVSTSFRIVSTSLANATVDAIADQNYTGYQICPTVTVRLGGTTLRQGTDYDVTYTNNTSIGTAYVTITGKGTYAGTSTGTTFKIVMPSVTNATIVSIPDQTYTGYQVCPTLTIYTSNGMLREGTDYTLSYTNNISIGTAYVMVTGIGAYSGTKQMTFRIVAPGISTATVTAIPDQLYTGYAITPSVTVSLNGTMLIQNVDYYVSYSNNRNVGTANVTITGRGNYSGSRSLTFRILAKDLANATVGSISTQKYTGNDITPSVTVKIGENTLTRNVDYTLTYYDNREPGTASIVIRGTGTCTGSKTVTFKIAQPSLSAATVKVSNKTYDGDEQTPNVTVRLNGVTLEEDEDYEIEYRNNVNVGKATVVIYGLGDYSGSKKAYFIIKPAKMKWKSAKAKDDSAVLKWKKQSRVDGYEVYRSKKKASGYKRLGTVDQDVTSCTNPRLSKGTYYYKVRSFVEIDGKKYYGAYSSVKKVKIG